MMKTPAPRGFTISFSRHKRGWGWKQTYAPDSPEHCCERFGFRTRRDALADLNAELRRREQREAAGA